MDGHQPGKLQKVTLFCQGLAKQHFVGDYTRIPAHTQGTTALLNTKGWQVNAVTLPEGFQTDTAWCKFHTAGFRQGKMLDVNNQMKYEKNHLPVK